MAHVAIACYCSVVQGSWSLFIDDCIKLIKATLEDGGVFRFRGLAKLGSPLVKLTLEKLAPILLLFLFYSLIKNALEDGGVFHFRGLVAAGQAHVGEVGSDTFVISV